MAAFTGLLDLQILLGIVMVALGCLYGALMGHLVMMAIAAIAAHGASTYARRQADPRRAHAVALVGIVVALALIAGGIAAIGRTPFSILPHATCVAASG
jgi:drug/metabolite transporter (DMT)-like permease